MIYEQRKIVTVGKPADDFAVKGDLHIVLVQKGIVFRVQIQEQRKLLPGLQNDGSIRRQICADFMALRDNNELVLVIQIIIV